MTALIHLYDRKHYLSTFYDISLQYVVTVEYCNISTAIEYLIDKIKVITYSADY